jgi:hypothetical protein
MRDYVLTAACCLSVLACASDQADDHSDSDAGKPVPNMIAPMQVLEPGMTYAGKSLEEWGVQYMRWTYSQQTCDTTTADQDGSLCGQFQTDADVFFLDRAEYATSRTPLTSRPLCHVPAGKALVVPIAVLGADNAGMMPIPEEILKRSVAAARDTMRDLSLRADGVDIADLDQRGFGPAEFAYHVPPAPNFFSCLHVKGVDDTDVQPSYVAGYFAVVAPPEPGAHELEYASSMTVQGHDLSYHVKVNLTVDERAE